MDASSAFARRRAQAANPKPFTEEEKIAAGVIETPTPEPAQEVSAKPAPPARRRQESYLPDIHRPLPQSMDAEKGTIGSIMLSPKRCMYEAEGTVGESHFHYPPHQRIFTTLREMHGDNEPIDLISVTQRLEDTGHLNEVGGAAYITELFMFVPTAANFSYYLEILCEKYKAREASLLFTQAAAAALEPGGSETLDTLLQSAADKIRSIQDIGKVNAGIEVHSFDDLANFDTKHDEDSVLGYRYLCRGGSCLVVGQSGIGKSSLGVQKAIRWGQGKSIFGLGPTRGRKLKSLFIQAENDKGDLAEMMQGVLRRYPVPEDTTREAFLAQMREQIVFARDTIHTGADFARCAARLIDKHKPDLVWVDPLLSYAGDDISSQKVASQFLRNTLNPIAFDTGIIWMLLHHTGKPSTDPKAKAHWTDHDFSYAAFGSSELVNWARAVMVLRSIGEGRFELRFSKRGKRTGVKEFQDPHVEYPKPAEFTDVVYIEHAKDAIYWEQIEKPADVEQGKKREKANGQFETQYSEEDIYNVMEKFENGRKPSQIMAVVKEQIGLKDRTFWNLWKKIKVSSRVIEKDGYWYANTEANQAKVYPSKS